MTHGARARARARARTCSQASFEPLGLTISVAKDRAIESLMQVGKLLVQWQAGQWEGGVLGVGRRALE